MNNFLFKQIDNTGLILFRVVFGLLIATEAIGAIFTGWVRRTLVDTPFTFNFIGFDFLQYFQGPGMYYYFVIMGFFGIFVMLGYKYRFSMIAYAIMWTGVYLMQKSSYNNHYYLMMLLCWIMAFLPANRWFSLDVKTNPALKTPAMPRWVLLVLILQVWIVYTFASVAKFYPDWLNASMPALLMRAKSDYWVIGELLQKNWVHWTIAYTGIFFDLLIVPLMLWRRTRLLGFVISVFFHLFNSIVFQIGIFPYMSIAFALFFFTPQILQKRFLPKKKIYLGNDVVIPNYKKFLVMVVGIYFAFQIGLPLRHWFFKDDVLWTEEGHRLSWRMMLRSKSGSLAVWIKESDSEYRQRYNYNNLIGTKQQSAVATKPDLMWQLAQKIKQVEAEKGKEVAVYMDSKVRVNGGEYHQFTNPEVNIALEKWHPFKHTEWILPSPKDYNEKPIKE
ncbi:HTTM domain-containing protein [Aequorivita sp. Q41]|uniref:HTTM domain-containing protein n=1 Tax=Aequorivita sp. Q41 TaxID=3153300 RepID=UPI003242D269